MLEREAGSALFRLYRDDGYGTVPDADGQKELEESWVLGAPAGADDDEEDQAPMLAPTAAALCRAAQHAGAEEANVRVANIEPVDNGSLPPPVWFPRIPLGDGVPLPTIVLSGSDRWDYAAHSARAAEGRFPAAPRPARCAIIVCPPALSLGSHDFVHWIQEKCADEVKCGWDLVAHIACF
eukprot:gene935-46218_t